MFEYSIDHMFDGTFELSLFDDDLDQPSLILIKTFITWPSEEEVLSALSMYKRLKDSAE